ncbi:hypothetical protein BLOT_000282 [Blomia tropicalis]|nr:hypothetical protein BLOT_000282 [Blomia tropicalis]
MEVRYELYIVHLHTILLINCSVSITNWPIDVCLHHRNNVVNRLCRIVILLNRVILPSDEQFSKIKYLLFLEPNGSSTYDTHSGSYHTSYSCAVMSFALLAI